MNQHDPVAGGFPAPQPIGDTSDSSELPPPAAAPVESGHDDTSVRTLDAAAAKPSAMRVRRPRTWRMRLAIVGLVLAGIAAWTVAAFVLGAGYGHRQADESTPDPQPITQVTVVVEAVDPPDPSDDGDATVRTPDVSGLDEDTARRVVAGASSDVEVTVSSRPAAGPSGLVIDQEPAAGATLAGTVTLVLSAPTDVPEVAGQPQADARDALEALGATVFISRQYVSGAQPGTALSTDPAAGTALPTSLTLVIAESPASIALADLAPVSGGCNVESAQANAVTYDNALRCGTSTSTNSFEVNLNRSVERFTATIALWDDVALDDVAVVEVLADGVPVFSQPVTFGQSVPIDISVTGVLRLTIRFTTPETKGNTSVVLGDASLVGSQQGIDSLDLRS